LVGNRDLIHKIAQITFGSCPTFFEGKVGVYVGLTPLTPEGTFFSVVDIGKLTLGLRVLIFILCCFC